MASIVVTPAPTTSTRTAPPARPEAVACKAGFIKVRLSYLTPEAKHVRSLMLQEYGAYPPYTEETCVLLPRLRVHAMLECFLLPFERLQNAGLVHEDAQLIDYQILDEDKYTIAYVL